MTTAEKFAAVERGLDDSMYYGAALNALAGLRQDIAALEGLVQGDIEEDNRLVQHYKQLLPGAHSLYEVLDEIPRLRQEHERLTGAVDYLRRQLELGQKEPQFDSRDGEICPICQTLGCGYNECGLRVVLAEKDAEIAELCKDKARMDWCEATAAKYPDLENDGLTPMTRASIDAAMSETLAKAEPCRRCGGTREKMPSGPSDAPVEACPDCQGERREGE